MKSYLLGIVLFCIVLASGCTPKPAVVPDPAPTAAVPSVQRNTTAPKAVQEPAPSQEATAKTGSGDFDDYQDIEAPDKVKGTEKEGENVTIADPWEPFNRAMFNFNDKMYFWVLKPVAQGYSKVVPEKARASVSNFYTNIKFPIRFVNNLLQGNLEGAASELGRFIINTVWGIGGLLDPASSKEINLKEQRADFGQTLGVYGLGHGFYIHWPLLGPSSPRDTVGTVGDIFLYPSIYYGPWYVWAGFRVHEKVNDASLQIGDYEALKEAAIDPYVAVRDAYVQYRLKMIKRQDTTLPAGASGLPKK
jgi:phospholipid-binding lipoprotein MlaA